MYCITNAGGGGGSSGAEAYAYIQTTFPSGSTCTATNGSITLNSVNTNGIYVFNIPEPSSTPETWTISCSSGSQDASEVISISSRYQVESVLLRYGVPSAYTILAALRTVSTQSSGGYIDTGMTPPSSTDEIRIDIDPGGPGTTNQSISGFLMWASYPSNTYQTVFQINSGQLYWRGSSVVSYMYDTNSDRRFITINNSVHGVEVVNDSSQILASGTVNGDSYTSAYGLGNLYLFGRTTNGSTMTPAIAIYSYKRYKNTTNELVQDFVPCRRNSDSVYGFYDLVSRTFHPWVGTASVISGVAL